MLFKGSSLRQLAAKLCRAMRWLSTDAIYAVQFVVLLINFIDLHLQEISAIVLLANIKITGLQKLRRQLYSVRAITIVMIRQDRLSDLRLYVM